MDPLNEKKLIRYGRVNISITGRVQGIGFRYFVKSIALKKRINGWIRNDPSGKVEAVLEGRIDKIEEMIQQCKKGPDRAEIEKIEVLWGPFKNEFKQFNIRI